MVEFIMCHSKCEFTTEVVAQHASVLRVKHQSITVTLEETQPAQTVFGNSEFGNGSSDRRLLLCNFLPGVYRNPLHGEKTRWDHLLFKYVHEACNFSAGGVSGSSTLGWEWKTRAAFEVTGCEIQITAEVSPQVQQRSRPQQPLLQKYMPLRPFSVLHLNVEGQQVTLNTRVVTFFVRDKRFF